MRGFGAGTKENGNRSIALSRAVPALRGGVDMVGSDAADHVADVARSIRDYERQPHHR